MTEILPTNYFDNHDIDKIVVGQIYQEVIQIPKILDMNIVPDYLITMAFTNKIEHSKPKQYSIANGNSDSCPDLLKNQPGVSENKFPFSKRIADYSVAAKQCDLANIFELELNDSSTSNDNELTLMLNANNQIHYIFITDDLGKIWYENEVDTFQQILTIDTDHIPTGSYNILIESNGSFAAKRFVKTT